MQKHHLLSLFVIVDHASRAGRQRCPLIPTTLRTRGATLRPRSLAHRALAAGIASLLGALALSACQDPDPNSALGRIKKAGRIVIATDALYPPDEFKQGERIVGFDVDLGTAVARKLGVKAEFQDVKFDTIMPALSAGEYDLSLSSVTDTKDRESRFDFVTYLSAGTVLMVRRGNPKRLRPDGTSLCGRRIAVETGTTQEDELVAKTVADPGAGARADACRNAGRPAPIRLSFDDQEAADRALARGSADAVLTDAPCALYGVRRSPARFEVSGRPYDTALYGIVVPKHRPELRDAVLRAVRDLMSDGSYRRMVARWGLSAEAVSAPRINAAG